eukprot:gene25160-10987_t
MIAEDTNIARATPAPQHHSETPSEQIDSSRNRYHLLGLGQPIRRRGETQPGGPITDPRQSPSNPIESKKRLELERKEHKTN